MARLDYYLAVSGRIWPSGTRPWPYLAIWDPAMAVSGHLGPGHVPPVYWTRPCTTCLLDPAMVYPVSGPGHGVPCIWTRPWYPVYWDPAVVPSVLEVREGPGGPEMTRSPTGSLMTIG